MMEAIGELATLTDEERARIKRLVNAISTALNDQCAQAEAQDEAFDETEILQALGVAMGVAASVCGKPEEAVRVGQVNAVVTLSDLLGRSSHLGVRLVDDLATLRPKGQA